MEEGGAKICHTYPIMIELGAVILYLRKIKKIYKSSYILFAFCWHHRLSMETSNFCYIKIYKCSLHFDAKFLIVLFLFYFLKVFFINIKHSCNLMMSARLAIIGLLNVKCFEIKVMTSWILYILSPTKLYQVSQIILYMWSSDQSLISLAFLWEKLS